MRLVNLLCTDSIALMSLTKNGFQTTQQYSKIGLTYVMNADNGDEASLVFDCGVCRASLLEAGTASCSSPGASQPMKHVAVVASSVDC